jgi:hypothetical protein
MLRSDGYFGCGVISRRILVSPSKIKLSVPHNPTPGSWAGLLPPSSLREAGETLYGHATRVEQYRVDLRSEGLPAWCGTGKLISTVLARLLRFACGGAIVDDAVTLVCGARMHLSLLQRELPTVL